MDETPIHDEWPSVVEMPACLAHVKVLLLMCGFSLLAETDFAGSKTFDFGAYLELFFFLVVSSAVVVLNLTSSSNGAYATTLGEATSSESPGFPYSMNVKLV